MPPSEPIPYSERDVRLMLGMLQGQLDTLVERVDAYQIENVEEHRKVHVIVDATSAAIRHVAEDVSEMKPIVKNYELRAASIENAVTLAKAYELEREERKGAAKAYRQTLTLLVSVCSLGGGAVAFLISKVFEYMVLTGNKPVPRSILDTAFSFLV